jgi:hypothetical protein
VTITRTLDAPVQRAPRRISAYAVACGGYTIVTVVVLRAIVESIATRVPHDLGDPLLSAAILWWNAHVMPLTERWWDGFAFWPSTGMLAFSDHRLGESLIASPLQWIGLGPIAAYNITLLAMFPLSAIAAHWLGHVLTRRHDAALVAGLAYGFNPYRVGHLEHLELLAAFGMPAALAALHLYMEQRRPRWLVVFGAAVLLQGLCCSYYVVYLGVLATLWVMWFGRRDSIHVVAGLAAAFAVAAAALSPIAWSYLRIHHHYGFTRPLHDIVILSADLTSFVTAAPLDALWRWTSSLNDTERQLFPGATILVLVIAAVVMRVRRERPAIGRNRAAIALTVFAFLCGVIAIAAAYRGGWRLRLGPLGLSIGTPFKPLSLTFLLLAIALLVSSPIREAYRTRSAFAFYLLAALFLAVCCLGPKPRVLGYQFLYEPPYAWLMRIRPIGESMRVPARFAMPMILALSAAAALAFARLIRKGESARVLVAIVATGIVADGWVAGLPMLDPPQRWPSQVASVRASAFLELPLGETEHDTDAMFHAVQAGMAAVNGYSGYEPSYYGAARVALSEHDDSVLEAFASRGPLIVLVDRRANWAIEALRWMKAQTGVHSLDENEDRAWFLVDPHAPPVTHCTGSPIPIAAARDRHRAIDIHALTDGREATLWATGTRQQTGDEIEFDLGTVASPCSIVLSFGTYVAVHPRRLNVATSTDGRSWTTAFEGPTGGQAVMSHVERPTDGRIEVLLPGSPARFVRCRLAADNPSFPWVVTDVEIKSAGDSP